jgi:carbon-monoxide dehydrogenase large subunit
MPCTPERVWKAIRAVPSGAPVEPEADAQEHFGAGTPNQDPGAGSHEGGAQ